MRRTAWIWALGCVVWIIDGGISLSLHSTAHAELAFMLATLFGIAWLFYRSQPR